MPCAEVGRLEKATRRDSARRNTVILQGFRRIRTACTNPPGSPKKAIRPPLTRGSLVQANCSTNFCLTTCLQDVFCSDDHDSSSFVLNMRGLHNYIMVNSLFRRRCIACRRCHGRLVIAPTVSNGNALKLESATGRMYPAPTHSDDSAAGLGAPGG